MYLNVIIKIIFFKFNIYLLNLFCDNVEGLCVKCQNYAGGRQTYAIQEA